MTSTKSVKRRKFAKAILEGETPRDASLIAGFKSKRALAGVTGSELMKDPEVQQTLEAALRGIAADERFVARKLKDGADRKPGALQLEYLDRISDYLGHGRQSAPTNNLNILSIISAGLVDAKGKAVDASKLVEP